MEVVNEALYEMTAEVRDRIKADLEERFPQVEFRSYWIAASEGHHLIAVEDSVFNDSKEYLRFLGELEKKYMPEYDVFDICFNYWDFDDLKHIEAE